MGIEAIGALVVAAVTAAGGWWGGRRSALEQNSSIAANTTSLLEASVRELERQNEDKEHRIAALDAKVEILESLITQRAEVDAVHEAVNEVRVVVDRIAHKVGA